jgi:hypothetical protein
MRRLFLANFTTAILLCGLMTSPAQAQDRVSAEMTGIIGQVSAVRGTGAARSLALNSPVMAGETVVTAPGARARLRFTDGSVIVLGENTEIKISRYRINRDERHVFLDLVKGLARSVVTKMSPKSSFEIQTPTAIAAVRSTVFCVEQHADGKMETVVVEGSLAVTSRGAQVARAILEPGFGTTVAKDKAPIAPEIWEVSRIDAMRSRAMIP